MQTDTYSEYVAVCLRDIVSKKDGMIFSLERTARQHVFRAGDGVHARWLELRRPHQSDLARLWTQWSWKHRNMLEREKKTFSPDATSWIIANSSMVRQEILERFSFPEERIRVIPAGVDIEHFRPCPDPNRHAELRQRFGLSRDAVVWGFVGSGFERKGLLWAIHIATAIRHRDVHLLVLGRGNYRDYLDAARLLNYGNRLVFAPENTSALDVLHASDAFILPTIYDPCSNAALEAAACGLPVITTRANGAIEWVTGVVLEDPTQMGESAEQCLPLASPLKIDHDALERLRARLDEKPCWEATEQVINNAAAEAGFH
jgi:UDP-glucose:(heptosyl)LPS alpha-1,3-glucosyltransferase